MADLEIDAELRLRTAPAMAGVRGLSQQLGALSTGLRGAEGASGGLFRSLVGFSVVQTTVSALVNGFQSLVGFAVNFSSSLENTRISLAAVMGAVEHVDFGRATAMASGVFEQLRDDALTSTATTAELFGIYQSIYGPIRGAGAGMEVVREITANTVTAASALGVDFAQASRDISLMARGTAGMHVRLYSMLRSTGAIAEDAHEWHQLTSPERIERLRSALGQFAAAGEAYGQSFRGVTSTFTDIVQSFTAAAFGPIFERIRSNLSQINAYLLANRESIIRYLSAAGEAAGRVMDTAVERGRAAFEWLTNNWDVILAKVGHFIGRMRALLPAMMRAAQAFAAIQIGSMALQATANVGAAATGAMALFGGGAAAGAGAAGAGAAGAGAAAALAIPGESAFGAWVASLGPLLTSAAVAMAPLALALTLTAGALTFVLEYWDLLSSALASMAGENGILGQIWADFVRIGEVLWGGLRPILLIVGFVVVGALIVALWLLAGVLRVVSFTLRLFAEGLAIAFDWMGFSIDRFTRHLREAVAFWLELAGMLPGGEPATHEGEGDFMDRLNEIMEEMDAARETPDTSTTGGAPGDRHTTHNDFRGSRITVNQEFREADPDRVALSMIEDLARFAEQRIQSGFVPALTR